MTKPTEPHRASHQVGPSVLANRLAMALISGNRKNALYITELGREEGLSKEEFREQVMEPAVAQVADYLEVMIPSPRFGSTSSSSEDDNPPSSLIAPA